MYNKPLFRRELRELKRHFTDASAEIVIPAPFTLISDIFGAVREHIRYVRAEQLAFQQRIQAVGLARLSEMSPREVLQRYGCD